MKALLSNQLQLSTSRTYSHSRVWFKTSLTDLWNWENCMIFGVFVEVLIVLVDDSTRNKIHGMNVVHRIAKTRRLSKVSSMPHGPSSSISCYWSSSGSFFFLFPRWVLVRYCRAVRQHNFHSSVAPKTTNLSLRTCLKFQPGQRRCTTPNNLCLTFKYSVLKIHAAACSRPEITKTTIWQQHHWVRSFSKLYAPTSALVPDQWPDSTRDPYKPRQYNVDN